MMRPLRDWPAGPQRPLPRTVVPFQAETVTSYVARLACANHLDPGQLRRYVAESFGGCARLDWLAIASGLSETILRVRLRGFAPDERSLANQPNARRPMCRLCMARRGINDPVYCVVPQHITVCHRHRLWTGSPVRSIEDQRDLRNKPEVLTAAKRHAWLARRHSDVEIESAVRDARHFCRYWSNSEKHAATTVSNDEVEAHLAAYPEIVAIAATLLTQSARPDGRGRSAPADLVRRINAQTDRTHTDITPIEQWLHNQRLAAAHRPGSRTHFVAAPAGTGCRV
ncbi:hypothetical protein B8W69_26445 [Mycobacterium vulneris]|uniref:TniQ protein n=1 Tax=Mycolicibacterium vulneris TaxID=547163 RepID=A0A1X2KKS6_9MYCO|nr:hypothetical protein B8W69_26445 [Mycolicibacterium vulneris]